MADAAAERVAAALREAGGFANYFGPQRFGRGAALALERGRELLQRRLCRPAGRAARRRHSGWLEGLELSGFQSALFNEWLARRVESGGARSLRRGDVLTRLPAGRPELGVELLRASPSEPSPNLPVGGRPVLARGRRDRPRGWRRRWWRRRRWRRRSGGGAGGLRCRRDQLHWADVWRGLRARLVCGGRGGGGAVA